MANDILNENCRILERDTLCAKIQQKENRLKSLYDEQEKLELSIIKDRQKMKSIIAKRKG